jgi:hypothetical protein
MYRMTIMEPEPCRGKALAKGPGAVPTDKQAIR